MIFLHHFHLFCHNFHTKKPHAGIKTPTYNMFGAFFGISQMRLPAENFPRILLMFFLYMCLVFRTLYQSCMYELTTTDMRKPLPTTFEDLHERNYTIVTSLTYEQVNEIYTQSQYPNSYYGINNDLRWVLWGLRI
jgi:hypothetical protein